MKYSVLFFLIIACASCNQRQKSHIPDIPINISVVDSLFYIYGNNFAVLACRTCDCFREEYNNSFRKTRNLPTGYRLLTDTNCNKFDFPVIHFPSSQMDKLSEDLYNLVLFKKENGVMLHKVIRVKDSKKIEKIAQLFFVSNLK